MKTCSIALMNMKSIINWSYKTDKFILDCSKIILEANKLAHTKRHLSKTTGMFFVPFGLILTKIIQSKLMLQRACIANFFWDSVLSTKYCKLRTRFL